MRSLKITFPLLLPSVQLLGKAIIAITEDVFPKTLLNYS